MAHVNRTLKTEPPSDFALPPVAYLMCVCGHPGKDHVRFIHECRRCGGNRQCWEFEEV